MQFSQSTFIVLIVASSICDLGSSQQIFLSHSSASEDGIGMEPMVKGLSDHEKLSIQQKLFDAGKSDLYVQPPVFAPDTGSFLEQHKCLPPISEKKLSSTADVYPTANLKRLLAQSAVNGTLLFTVPHDGEVNEDGFKDMINALGSTWGPILHKHPDRIVAFTCQPWLKQSLSNTGFHVFCDKEFEHSLYGQADQEPGVNFRFAAVSELVMSAGYSSLYIGIENGMEWGNIDPFVQLQKLDPDGEAFFSPDEFLPNSTNMAWSTNLHTAQSAGTPAFLQRQHRKKKRTTHGDDTDESPCCSAHLLPLSTAFVFTRPTKQALRLVRRMKERTIPVEKGGGGLCTTHAGTNLALFEGCHQAQCRTLDPFLFPSEAWPHEDKYQVAKRTIQHAMASSKVMAAVRREN